MTSLGHSLVGASVGVLCIPGIDKLHRRLIIFVATIAVASLPDWPLPDWGHFSLALSHSIVVNGAVIVCLVVGLCLKSPSFWQVHRCVIIGLIAAWLSHFLLDALYVDSRLAIFWPLSEATISLPVPWLKTLPHVPPPFDEKVVRILMFETLTFMLLLVLAAVIRWRKATARMHVDSK